jgi:hypothetical protein
MGFAKKLLIVTNSRVIKEPVRNVMTLITWIKKPKCAIQELPKNANLLIPSMTNA